MDEPSVFHAPWRGPIEDAVVIDDLNGIYQTFSPGLEGGHLGLLVEALNIRKRELEQKPAHTAAQIVSVSEKLAQIEQDSFDAQIEYGKTLDDWATAHTHFKTLRAQTYTKFRVSPDLPRTRGDGTTVADTDMWTDADEAVGDARFKAYLAEGKMKAAKSNLDRLERSFQYHRSLLVNERKADERG